MFDVKNIVRIYPVWGYPVNHCCVLCGEACRPPKNYTGREPGKIVKGWLGLTSTEKETIPVLKQSMKRDYKTEKFTLESTLEREQHNKIYLAHTKCVKRDKTLKELILS